MATADTTKPILSTPLPEINSSNAVTPQKILNVRSVGSVKTPAVGASTSEKNDAVNSPAINKGKPPPKTPDEFFKDLYQFHDKRATPIVNMPRISGRIVDLHKLYSEVTERGGFLKVNVRDEWDEIVPEIGVRDRCLNATAAIKIIYRRFLEKYERQNFFGEDPDKMEALEASDPLEIGRSGRARYPSLHNSSNNSSLLNAVPMSYNYRQHIVNMDRRRTNKMSTDLHKSSPYEKLMLSLLSPLPNEQDFAINVCTVMTNESKHTLKLNEYPKLLDILLAHTGIFADYTLHKLFQHVYAVVRENSLYGFWRDLLHDKPQILELYADEQTIRGAAFVEKDIDLEKLKANIPQKLEEYLNEDFFNLRRGEGTQDFVGQRVQQITMILRNLSFFDENISVFAQNRTFLRFVVMAANTRWGNIHMQALDIAGNIATELKLLDPTTDDLSRSLMATLCDGIEGMDRAVILNCLEILYKICQIDSNEEYVNKCLNFKFYETLCLFLSLNDIMLLIYTLETIYSLTSTGARSCHLLMQVRGIVDQLVALITVEAQSYGPDGCILMRVVETVPGNMLPMVAQNIANLQNVAVKQQPQQIIQPTFTLQPPTSAVTTVIVPQPTTTVPVVQLSEFLPQPNVDVQQQQPKVEPIKVPQQVQPQPQLTQQIQLQQPPPPPIQQPQQQQPPAQTTPQMSTSYTQEDEQYALAWLGASFERTGTTEIRVEQQELYRMYLSHCQKSGKHSVVNQLQFPRLVRLIFNQNVGPIVVRGADGLDLPGFYYVGIRLRAQPLPIQSKSGQPILFKAETPSPARKVRKKIKPQPIPPAEQSNDTNSSSSESKSDANTNPSADTTDAKVSVSTIVSTEQGCFNTESSSTSNNNDEQTMQIVLNSDSQQPSTSLIKSLLANKVTQRQQKQKELIINPNGQPTTIVSGSTTITTATAPGTPIKVASNAISALVNNPLMQNTSVKVGQTTIKPLGLAQHIEKKPLLESTPPPLAPLSGNNVTKDSSGRQIIIATTTPRLVDIGDKKTHALDPSQIPATIIKRKLNDDDAPPPLANKRLALDETPVTPSKSAANLYAEIAASILEDEDMDEIPQIVTTNTTSTTRSFIEQTQQPHIQMQPQQHQQQLVRIQQQPTAVATIQQPVTISNPMQQRQLVFQTTTPTLPQLKPQLTQSNQIPTAMATIKTDQGLQTVPVILQQKPMDPQHMLHPTHIGQQQTTTQYVLATNPQGQTYLVAQQTPTAPPTPPPPPTQTVLVTQTPQQQSTGTKTIIILQQQPGHPGGQTQQIITTSGAVGGQKMIMTTPQGQQVLVTQRGPTTSNQPQFFINPQTGAATHIQHIPTTCATTFQRQIIHTPQQQQLQHQQHAGQISPTLLSQLNQIPATIKLHQPQPLQLPQHPQPATISRIGKPVSIMQTGGGGGNGVGQTATAQIQIPQLQQHQSIIQQHIITGSGEKRQVIVGGGRAIEIKETIITQAQPPPQQSQLNAQTIITTQHQQQPMTSIIQPPQQHQQQQIIVGQQKVVTTTHQTTLPTASIITPKLSEPPSLIATTNVGKAQSVVQTMVPQATQATLSQNIKKMVTAQQQHQQSLQQVKMQTSTTSTTTSGPPPLAAVSNTTGHMVTETHQSSVDIKLNESSAGKINTPSTVTTSSVITATSSSNTIATSTATQNVQQTRTTINSSATPPTIISTPTNIQPSLPTPTLPPHPTLPHPSLPHPSLPTVVIPPIDPNWPYICDWRNCPRRKYKSLRDLQYHVTIVHCPDHLDTGAEIFCQWGAGPNLCDGVPRKRFSLMTHLIDRHLSVESLKAGCQRRIAAGTVNVQPAQPPVTIMRNPDKQQSNTTTAAGTTGPGSTTTGAGTGGSANAGARDTMGFSALHAIKRHTADFINAKELLDENEGPVTKSIRLTAALILRNLVTYTETAKRNLRRYETHLANIALSTVESSSALSHILAELNN